MVIDPNQRGMNPGGPTNLPRKPGVATSHPGGFMPPKPVPGRGTGVPGRGPGVPGNPFAGGQPPMKPPVARPMPGGTSTIPPMKPPVARPMPGNTGPMKPPMKPPVAKPLPRMATPPGPGNLPPGGGVTIPGPYNLPPMQDNGGVASHGPGGDPGMVPLDFQQGRGRDPYQEMIANGGGFAGPGQGGGIATKLAGGLYDQLMQRRLAENQFNQESGMMSNPNPALQIY